MDEVITDEQQQQQSNEVVTLDDARLLVHDVAQDAANKAVDAVNVQQVAQDAASSAADGVASRVDASIAPLSSGVAALTSGGSGSDDVAVDDAKNGQDTQAETTTAVASVAPEQWDYLTTYVQTSTTLQLFSLLLSALLVGVLLFREFSRGFRR